jgi:predicted Zn finger-like uncharacterized protein
MDVRCERCKAQYVFDDDQVTPSGLTVQCTHCGHLFRVKKKELVVTVAVKPEELDGPPLPATAAAPRASGGAAAPAPVQPEGQREWRVRRPSGNLLTFRELTTLQKWIVEEKVGRDDEISASGDGSWRRLGDISELAAFFQVVEAATRNRRRPPAPPFVPAPPVAAPPVPARPPSPPVAASAGPVRPPPPPAAARPVSPARPPPPVVPPQPPAVAVDVDLGPDDLAAVGKGRVGRVAFALGALAVVAAGGTVAYLQGPRFFPAKATAPEAVDVPLAIDLRTPGPAAPGAPPADPVPGAPAAGLPSGDAPAAAESASGGGEAKVGAAAEARTHDGAAVAAPETGAAQLSAPVPLPEQAVPSPPPPEPLAVVAAAPPPSAVPKALVAQAARLRERGDVDGALALYARAIELEPRNVAALTGRGLCYLDLETYPPAEASFEAALRVRPDDADGLLGLAETYRWQGKRANAIRYYERYLAAHPAGEEASVARNALEELRK